MRLATFNVQNMRLRERGGRPLLDAARDGDVDYGRYSASLAEADRRLTANLLRKADADVVALQEVFDQRTLDFFHDTYLTTVGLEAYDHRVCLPGNDGRGLNVALLSRFAPLAVTSHATETGRTLHLGGMPEGLRDAPVFRRDCLEVQFARFTLFICHFKAPYPDAERAFAIRHAEARAVRALIEKRFAAPPEESWIIAGDFNEPGYDMPDNGRSALAPLLDGFAVDLAEGRPSHPDWTFEMPDSRVHSRPDRILVSPHLAQTCQDARLEVIHAPKSAQTGPGIAPHPSDHALVLAELAGI